MLLSRLNEHKLDLFVGENEKNLKKMQSNARAEMITSFEVLQHLRCLDDPSELELLLLKELESNLVLSTLDHEDMNDLLELLPRVVNSREEAHLFLDSLPETDTLVKLVVPSIRDQQDRVRSLALLGHQARGE